jgi:hypothetical protein
MKKIFGLAGILVLALILCTGGMAYAVPSLGLATGNAYVGEAGQTELEPYQAYFVDTLIPGTGEPHGFLIEGSPETLTLFTNILDAPIFLLTSSDVEAALDPHIDGADFTEFAGTGQFDGYKPLNYWGLYVDTIDSSDPTAGGWYQLPSAPFSDEFNPGPYYALDVTLTFTGLAPGVSYFFLVADVNGDGLHADSGDPDPFSPKTDSAFFVPEASTLSMMVIGGVLIILGIVIRRKAYSRAK